MEIFELKYFLAVAQHENVHRGAEEVSVSPASLSKAIQRLEEELQTSLFYKSGRGIRLTDDGKALQLRARQIIQLEEDTRLQILGKDQQALHIHLAGEEVLLGGFIERLSERILGEIPKANVHWQHLKDDEVIDKVKRGQIHFGIITSDAPKDLESKLLQKVEFQTCISREHELASKAKKSISIDEVLKYPFVAPDSSFLGKISQTSSLDGWRDDRWPRDIRFRVSSVKLMEILVLKGMAVGYWPEYLVKNSGFLPLNISDCSYSCRQSIRIITKDSSALGWLQHIWSKF